MSYNNGYNQYSPYSWQQQSNGQDGRGQYQNTSRLNGSYPSNSYQPLSAYQTSVERQTQPSLPQPAKAPVNSYGSQGYGNFNTTEPDSRDTQASYVGSRADTSAMGNLAYASQVIDYNRTQTPTNHSNTYASGTNSGLPVAYGDTRAESRGLGSTRNQNATQPQSYPPYLTAEGASSYSTQGYSSTNGKDSPAQQQYMPSHVRPGNNASQPPRPASGQAVQRPSSRTSVQSSHSPQISNMQANNQAAYPSIVSPKIGVRDQNAYNRTPASASQQPAHHPSSSGNPTNPKPTNTTSQYRPHPPASISVPPQRAENKMNTQYAPQTQSRQEQYKPGPDTQRPANINAQANGYTSQQATPVESHHPTTVDPNQVFNEVEYRRRQAEAEAARKSAEAAKQAAASKATEVPTPHSSDAPNIQGGGERAQSMQSQPSDVMQAAQAFMGTASTGDPDSAKKDQMELEMKQMIEKMRDYKAKDPSLFSQIWEQVKKGQAPQRAPSQPIATSPTTGTDKPQSPGFSQLPAESELPAASAFPSDFDRGRYPQQRRKRGNKVFNPDKPPKHKSQGSAEENPAADEMTVTPSQQLPPHNPETNDADSGHGSIKRAMEHFSASMTPNAPTQPVQSRKKDSRKEAAASAAPTSANHASTATQSLSKSQKPSASGQTYWPEDKKSALADAARAALLSHPRNLGKTVTSREIRELLDQNPSYAQMCEHLESAGFVIDRATFARMLLAAVPDLTTSSTPKAPPPSQQSEPRRSHVQTSGSTYMAPQQLTTTNDIHWSDHRNIDAQKLNSNQVLDERGKIAGRLYPRQNGAETKAAKAHKRSFGEIVDLTQALPDEEDFQRHQPRQRVDDGLPPSVHAGTLNDRVFDPVSRTINPAPARPEVERKTLDEFRYTASDPQSHLLTQKIVEPMNKRRDALRRSSYNPKTIARDILLASGKHPYLAPLNNHLDGLRGRFNFITYDSDLSTLRWDLLDPGGEPAPDQKRAVNAGAEDADDEDADSFVARRGPGERVQVAVVVGSGNTPKKPSFGMQPLDGQQKPPYTGRKRGRKPKTETDPGAAFKEALRGVDTTAKAMEARPVTVIQDMSFTPVAKSGISSPKYGGSQSTLEGFTGLHTPTPHVPGRRGRPPGAKNKSPRSDKGIPKKNAAPIANSSTLANGFQRIEATPMRPSGLRNSISAPDGFAVVVESRSPSVVDPGSARKEKPSREMLKEEDTPSTPSFKSYKCQWENCPAELHSLEILLKHIRKHPDRREDDMFFCKWNGCDNKFYAEDTWEKHIERKHLRSYGLEQGETPMKLSNLSPSKSQASSPVVLIPS